MGDPFLTAVLLWTAPLAAILREGATTDDLLLTRLEQVELRRSSTLRTSVCEVDPSGRCRPHRASFSPALRNAYLSLYCKRR